MKELWLKHQDFIIRVGFSVWMLAVLIELIFD